MKLLALLLVAICFCFLSAECDAVLTCGEDKTGMTSRHVILNGQRVQFPHDYPWMVSIRYRRYRRSNHCGGVLIHPSVVLTAAHCTIKHQHGRRVTLRPSKLVVYVGAHDLDNRTNETRLRVQKIASNPGWSTTDLSDYGHDLALLFLRDSSNSSRRVKKGTAAPICLPQGPEDEAKPGKEPVCLVLGWRRTDSGGVFSDVLRETKIPVIPPRLCKMVWERGRENKTKYIDNSMFCAGYRQVYRRRSRISDRGSCEGDRGEPLQCPSKNGYWTVNGISSWGHFTCMQKYSVFANVSSMKRWIKEQLTKRGFELPQPPVVIVETTTGGNSTFPGSPSRSLNPTPCACNFRELHIIRGLALPGGVRVTSRKSFSVISCIRECSRIGRKCAAVTVNRRLRHCFTHTNSECDYEHRDSIPRNRQIIYVGRRCK